MKRFTCWSSTSIAETVFSDIAGLSRELDALFLAAHTPARVAQRTGAQTQASAAGEVQVLRALLDDVGKREKNSIIAVLGEPGTGKSHIVRWVNAQLHDRNLGVHVLYVPREVQTLRDLLRVLIGGLPGGRGEDMLRRVDEALGNVNEAEIASRLRGEMEQSLRWGFPVAVPPANEDSNERTRRENLELLLGVIDTDGQRHGGIADVVGLPAVREHLERPDGTLRAIASSAIGRVKSGGEALTSFSPEDVPARIAGNTLVRQFMAPVKMNPEPFLSLLGAALAQAYPRFVGLNSGSGETLSSLFRDARKDLRREGTELILLFEDLAQFGLLDESLFEEFSIPPGESLAPLRVVFAITNVKWEERVPKSVQQRTTHLFEVMPIEEVGAQAGQFDSRITDFLARYLNLVRLGRARVEAAWSSVDESSRETQSWVPNACKTRNHGGECEFIDDCHGGFGSAGLVDLGEVGTYPFNASSIDRLRIKMGDDAGNPRELIKHALEEILTEAGAQISNGSYPGSRVRDQFDVRSVVPVQTLREGHTGDTGDRLLWTNIIWGNDSVGTDVYIRDAFDLPMAAVPSKTSVQSGSETAHDSTSAQRKVPLPLLAELNAWTASSDGLETSVVERIRGWLYALVLDRLSLDQDLVNVSDGIGSQILAEEFRAYSFNFQGVSFGRRPTAGRLAFELTPDQHVKALIGLLWWQHVGTWRESSEYDWPAGYSAAELQRALDRATDEWAHEVRSTVLKQASVETRDAVLGIQWVARRVSHPTGTEAWTEVIRAATGALGDLQPQEWLTNLFAVRQGDGGAQLINTVGASEHLESVRSQPWTFLNSLTDEMGQHPRIQAAAQALTATIDAAAVDQVDLARKAIADIDTLLEGSQPEDVAVAGRNFLRRSLPSLFRPAQDVDRFERTCTKVETLGTEWAALDRRIVARSCAQDSAILFQETLPAVVQLSQGLAYMRQVAADTESEARSRLRGTGGGAVPPKQAVNMALTAIDLLEALTGATS